MAESNVDGFRNYLECRICLDTFVNPRRLECNHHFCQRCLEEILQFESDGSANIVCPLRCDTITHLGPTETVSKLPISYEFKGLLESLIPDKDKVHSDAPICSCGKAVTIYCCKKCICLPCFIGDHRTHDVQSQKVTSTHPLTFNRKTGELEVVCEKHSTGCGYFFEDNFFCFYCRERDEKHLNPVTDTVKATADTLEERMKDEQNAMDNIFKHQKATESYIASLQKKLEMCLHTRQVECLRQYESYLDEKKAEVMEEYEMLSAAHLQQYFSAFNYLYVLESYLEGGDSFLCIEKSEILEEIDNNKNRKDGVFVEKITLSPFDSFLSEKPLGDLSVRKTNEMIYNDAPTSTFICVNKDIEELEVEEFENENGRFEKLSQLIKTYERKILTIDRRMNAYLKVDSFKEEIERLRKEKNISVSQFLRTPLQVLPQVFLEISVDGACVGNIIIDLYCNDVPKTCENFIHLCLHTYGFGYKNSTMRPIKLRGKGNVHCTGGKILGEDNRGKSIFGPSFERENFIRKHNDKGIITMPSHIGASSNAFCVDSIFNITSKPQPNWDEWAVAFGKVTDETYRLIQLIICLNETSKERNIIISDCGVFR